MAKDIGRLQARDLGRFDLILALCVVYHELNRMPRLVKTLAAMTDHLVLQANESHGGELGRYARADYHLRILAEAGFRHVELDAPPGYALPILVAKK
jgi:hypothetical protein